MGPQAKVLERVVPVRRDGAAAGTVIAVLVLALCEVFYRLQLVRLVLEELAGLVGVQDPATKGVVAPNDPAHPALDLREIAWRQGARQVEIVVEAVLEPVVGRSPGELRFGEHLPDRLRHHVGRGVTQPVRGIRAIYRGHGTSIV